MLIFDLEANGLLNDVTTIHCLCIYDTETDVMERYRPSEVQAGINRIQQAINDGIQICGHNIINYDIPVMVKLYNLTISHEQEPLVIDTLVLARLIYSNIDTIDLGLLKSGKLPSPLYKSQTLKAWGYRLGELKGNYGEQEEAWAVYNEEMLTYNEQDVVVTVKLYEKLTKANYSQRAIGLEHKVAWLMARQERNGFPFDLQKAVALEGLLTVRQVELNNELRQIVPQIPDEIFIPKRNNKTKGYIAGVPIQRYKPFKPTSRQQVEYVLRQMYNYSPNNEELYDVINAPADECIDLSKYRLKVDEETFKYIKEDPTAPDEVKTFVEKVDELLLISKRLGQLADGKHAWLKEYDKTTKSIHGRVIPNGAVSGRATHSSPNVAQVPSVNAPYGKECRELFNAGGWYQVGTDASGLELRCLAHYMYPYDNGEYAHELLNGDIHTKNQMNAGLPRRNDAKTFIYAFLYGAGDAKIGSIINGTATDGRRIKSKFLKATPAIRNLKNAVQDVLAETDRGQVKKWKRHYLKGLDGRLLHVRSLHSALNLLLQSAGAIICKKWIVTLEDRLLALGLKHGWDGDFAIMAWIHDELQIACRTKEIAVLVTEESQKAMRDTQAYFNFRVVLDTESKIGLNWAECH